MKLNILRRRKDGSSCTGAAILRLGTALGFALLILGPGQSEQLIQINPPQPPAVATMQPPLQQSPVIQPVIPGAPFQPPMPSLPQPPPLPPQPQQQRPQMMPTNAVPRPQQPNQPHLQQPGTPTGTGEQDPNMVPPPGGRSLFSNFGLSSFFGGDEKGSGLAEKLHKLKEEDEDYDDHDDLEHKKDQKLLEKLELKEKLLDKFDDKLVMKLEKLEQKKKLKQKIKEGKKEKLKEKIEKIKNKDKEEYYEEEEEYAAKPAYPPPPAKAYAPPPPPAHAYPAAPNYPPMPPPAKAYPPPPPPAYGDPHDEYYKKSKLSKLKDHDQDYEPAPHKMKLKPKPMAKPDLYDGGDYRLKKPKPMKMDKDEYDSEYEHKPAPKPKAKLMKHKPKPKVQYEDDDYRVASGTYGPAAPPPPPPAKSYPPPPPAAASYAAPAAYPAEPAAAYPAPPPPPPASYGAPAAYPAEPAAAYPAPPPPPAAYPAAETAYPFAGYYPVDTKPTGKYIPQYRKTTISGATAPQTRGFAYRHYQGQRNPLDQMIDNRNYQSASIYQQRQPQQPQQQQQPMNLRNPTATQQQSAVAPSNEPISKQFLPTTETKPQSEPVPQHGRAPPPPPAYGPPPPAPAYVPAPPPAHLPPPASYPSKPDYNPAASEYQSAAGNGAGYLIDSTLVDEYNRAKMKVFPYKMIQTATPIEINSGYGASAGYASYASAPAPPPPAPAYSAPPPPSPPAPAGYGTPFQLMPYSNVSHVLSNDQYGSYVSMISRLLQQPHLPTYNKPILVAPSATGAGHYVPASNYSGYGAAGYAAPAPSMPVAVSNMYCSHGKKCSCTLYLTEINEQNMLISGVCSGLSKNKYYALHIYEYGDVTQGCESVSGHYNPRNTTHGHINGPTNHVGDLGNIKTDGHGVAFVNKLKRDALSVMCQPHGRTFSILGRSLGLSDSRDDLGLGGNYGSLKTGNSGRVIACGVIGLANKDNSYETRELKMAIANGVNQSTLKRRKIEPQDGDEDRENPAERDTTEDNNSSNRTEDSPENTTNDNREQQQD